VLRTIEYRIGEDQSAGVPVSFLVRVGSVIRSLPGLRMTSPGSLLAAAGRGAAPCRALVSPDHDQIIPWREFEANSILRAAGYAEER
jgi:hypothetical protein